MKNQALNKSYFDLYARSGQRPHRINLSLNREKKQRDSYIDKEPTITYEFEIPETGIRIKKELHSITSLEHTDIIRWTEEFRQAAIHAQWKEESAVLLLKNIINSELQIELTKLTSLESCLNRLLKLKYPDSKSHLYHRKATSIVQTEFYWIEDYAKEQELALKEYFISKNSTRASQEEKIDELFFENLAESTKLYLTNHAISTKNEAIRKIQAVEECLKQLAIDDPGSQKIPNDKDSRIGNRDLPRDARFQSEWCPRHGTASHDKSKCYSKNRNYHNDQKKTTQLQKNSLESYKNSKDKNPNRNYLLKEPLGKIDSIKIQGKINTHEVEMLVDTGATHNYISQEKANKLELGITKETEHTRVGIPDGSSIEVVGAVNVQMEIKGNEGIRYKEKLLVMEKLDAEIILGVEFLKRQSVKLDFHAMKLGIGDFTLLLEPKSYYEMKETPENEYFQSSHMYNLAAQANTDREFSKMIQKYERLNPELGEIPNVEFTINVKNDIPIKKYPYSIPYKYQEKIKEEVEKLIGLNIIRKSYSNYGFPAFPVLKKNDEIRLVTDYRKLNENLDDSAYPFPDLWDHLRSVPESEIFSQLDISMGYHNIRIKEEGRYKTAFVLPWG